jgi:hypothetical protein
MIESQPDNLQPVPHLSSDQLSAFAENMLPEHERVVALTHLADCPDCRQVVFLAQKSGPTLTAPAPAIEAPRRRWFTFAQFFGAATAALACSLILALIIHMHRDQSAPIQAVTTAKVEQPDALAPAIPAPTTPSAQRSAPVTHAAVAPAIPRGPAPPPKPALVLIAPTPQIVPVPQTLNASGTGITTGHFTELKQKGVTSFNANSTANANNYALLPPKAPTSVGGIVSMPAAAPAKSRQRASYVTADSLAAPAPPPAGASSQATNGVIDAASLQQLRLSGVAALNKAAAKSATAPIIQLPSNKPAANVLHATGRTLALDTDGNLFLSLDSGKRWTAVSPQWPGKAIAISLSATPARFYLQQPSQTQTQANLSGDANGLPLQQAPVPASGFDLTTATGAVWHSTDGITWHAR